MQFRAASHQLINQPADLLVLGIFQNLKFSPHLTAIDLALNNLLSSLIKAEDFKAKPNHTLLVHTHSKIPAQRVLLVGLGKKSQLSLEKIRRASATALKIAKKIKAQTIASDLLGSQATNLKGQDIAAAIATGALLANYTFTKYQPQKARQEKKHPLKTWTIVSPLKDLKPVQAGISRTSQIFPGIKLARDLVNEPGLKATPSYLVKQARTIASQTPRISLKVYNRKQLAKMAANALLAVARGSDEPPYLIHLTYKPQTKPSQRIALVGKGLTFDTGGYSLKPSDGMQTMKIDMAGAATVLGIFKVLSHLNITAEVHGIIPATENLVSGSAIKPGDIVTALNGTTIEILNTDAEGRLILADALSYVDKYLIAPNQPLDAIIDFATLTGACVVALGEQIAGLFSSHSQLEKQLRQASSQTGEILWPMPLVKDYRQLIKSDIADIQNIGKTKWGGAITAALFLKEFVPPNTPWAHLDIAGPAWEEKGTAIPYLPKGGTGFPVRTILRFLSQL